MEASHVRPKLSLNHICDFDTSYPNSRQPLELHQFSNLSLEISHRTATMAPGMSLFSVNAIVILSSEDGSRVFAKYYNAPHHSSGPSTSPSCPTPLYYSPILSRSRLRNLPFNSSQERSKFLQQHIQVLIQDNSKKTHIPPTPPMQTLKAKKPSRKASSRRPPSKQQISSSTTTESFYIRARAMS